MGGILRGWQRRRAAAQGAWLPALPDDLVVNLELSHRTSISRAEWCYHHHIGRLARASNGDLLLSTGPNIRDQVFGVPSWDIGEGKVAGGIAQGNIIIRSTEEPVCQLP